MLVAPSVSCKQTVGDEDAGMASKKQKEMGTRMKLLEEKLVDETGKQNAKVENLSKIVEIQTNELNALKTLLPSTEIRQQNECYRIL